MIIKAVSTIDLTVSEGERAVVARVSTNTVDRVREVVLPKGGDFKNYRKNPVVLFGHNSELPIGKADWIRANNDEVIAKTLFAETDFAVDIFKLFQSKVLNAFSIGFMPTDGGPPEEKEILDNPSWAKARWVIRKWELFEYSAVSVPANPEALAMAVSKGLDITAETMDRLGVADPRKRRSILIPGVSDLLSREKPNIGNKILIIGG